MDTSGTLKGMIPAAEALTKAAVSTDQKRVSWFVGPSAELQHSDDGVTGTSGSLFLSLVQVAAAAIGGAASVMVWGIFSFMPTENQAKCLSDGTIRFMTRSQTIAVC